MNWIKLDTGVAVNLDQCVSFGPEGLLTSDEAFLLTRRDVAELTARLLPRIDQRACAEPGCGNAPAGKRASYCWEHGTSAAKMRRSRRRAAAARDLFRDTDG